MKLVTVALVGWLLLGKPSAKAQEPQPQPRVVGSGIIVDVPGVGVALGHARKKSLRLSRHDHGFRVAMTLP